MLSKLYMCGSFTTSDSWSIDATGFLLAVVRAVCEQGVVWLWEKIDCGTRRRFLVKRKMVKEAMWPSIKKS